MAEERVLKTTYRWLRSKAPFATFITALAAILLNIVVSRALQWSETLLISAVVILSVLTMLYLQDIKSYIARHLETQPTIISTGQTKHQIEEGYKKMTEAVQAANEQILVLGADLTGMPQEKRAVGRSHFLATIEEIIRTKVERNEQFMYKRIVQSSAPNLIPHELTSDHVDEPTFIHCRKVAEMTGISDEVDFKLYVRKPITSCPSILVVDEKYVSFAMVGDYKEYDKETSEYKYNRSIQGMVHITDQANVLSAHYARLIERFAANEPEIHGYDRDAYSTDQTFMRPWFARVNIIETAIVTWVNRGKKKGQG